MQITETKVKVSDLCKNYSDNGDGGVFGFDGKLTIGYLVKGFTEGFEQARNSDFIADTK